MADDPTPPQQQDAPPPPPQDQDKAPHIPGTFTTDQAVGNREGLK